MTRAYILRLLASALCLPLCVVSGFTIRHGESQWNLENRFTGWYNIQLSPKGEKEAAEGGKLINEAGYKFGKRGYVLLHS